MTEIREDSAAVRQVEFVTEASTKIAGVEYFKGDRKSFPAEEAALYIKAGWAKCVETGEVGTLVPGAARIEDVVNRVSSVAASE